MVGNKIIAAIRPDGKVYSVNNSSGGSGSIVPNSVLHQNHGHFPVKIRSNSGSNQFNMSDNSDIVMNNNRLQASVMDMGKKLLQCARDNDVIGVESLIAKGSPFASDWLGMTAIHFAAMNDGYEICKLLTNTGINKDARTKVDRTPLHLAAFYGHERIVKLLIDCQCSLNPRDMLRMTPLHWAVEKRHKSIVRLLIKHNADVTAISKFGKTPIALAVLTEQADILQELEAARQMQQSRKYNEQHEKTQRIKLVRKKETNEAVNSIMGLSSDTNYEPSEKRFRLNSESDKQPTKTYRKDSIHSSDEKVQDNPAVNLLKSHGISIMNDDEDTSNKLLTTALQNGRQLVLSEGGKLLLNEAKKMSKTPFSETVKIAAAPHPSSAPPPSIPMGVVKLTNKPGTKQIETKFRPNIIHKSKPTITTSTPKDVTGKNIRIISLNDFKKIYGNGNIKSMPNTINKSQVVKIKTQKPPVPQIKEEQPEFIEYDYDPQYEDEENDLPPNIIKVSAESDQDDLSDFESVQTATATINPPAPPSPEPPIQSSTSTQNNIRYSFTKSPNKAATLPERTPVIPLLTIPEICRQLLELRKQNDELRRKYEIAQKEKEDFRNRLERLESLLIEEQPVVEEITEM
ncbi:ankyrin repeat domain-containing protein 17 isoform X4 [Eupeodes corollae]|uniref:ankyrin repeat domain-containing protein 17 isoform X4 n=1 Tax=Eupeodes corollae TaxID=290404 RepID=UPI002490084F|nr:ankyrin repeat domain-containing protein 17 isoform X4 [Eupeodes corollae]